MIYSNMFLFIEKKPYDEIQIGIMPDQKEIMPTMIKWVENYRKKKYRRVKLYYTSDDISVYEIINDPGSSNVLNVLFHKNMEN